MSVDREAYSLLEDYMLRCMGDSAHDKEHIYRVLYNGLEIGESEQEVDYDILIAACLLHDIGRKEQFDNPALCHAMVGGDKAFEFLVGHGFDAEYAEKVRQCIQTHRYRKDREPHTLEGKILFDADKLDASGTVGIARTLMYKGIVSEPLYSMTPDGKVSTGDGDKEPSFFQEYKYKLEGLYSDFYTRRGAQIARKRQRAAAEFYESLYQEVSSSYERGRGQLDKVLQPAAGGEH